MPEKCIQCGKTAEWTVRALEVRTLPVRGLTGEKRVQALGDFVESGVCDSCARSHLDSLKSISKSSRKKVTVFSAVLIAGILIEIASFLFLKSEKVFILLGIFAVICGVLGIYDSLKKAKEKSAELHAMTEKDALEEAAWDVFLEEAPSKEGTNDLTYIPVNERSLKRKNGDLMILYHLLPEIAVEAWKRMHTENETKEETL